MHFVATAPSLKKGLGSDKKGSSPFHGEILKRCFVIHSRQYPSIEHCYQPRTSNELFLGRFYINHSEIKGNHCRKDCTCRQVLDMTSTFALKHTH